MTRPSREMLYWFISLVLFKRGTQAYDHMEKDETLKAISNILIAASLVIFLDSQPDFCEHKQKRQNFMWQLGLPLGEAENSLLYI